jgi:hypothetical protein
MNRYPQAEIILLGAGRRQTARRGAVLEHRKSMAPVNSHQKRDDFRNAFNIPTRQEDKMLTQCLD